MLAAALSAEDVVASSFPDNMMDSRVEHWVRSAAREGVTLTRESTEFEHVTVVVVDNYRPRCSRRLRFREVRYGIRLAGIAIPTSR